MRVQESEAATLLNSSRSCSAKPGVTPLYYDVVSVPSLPLSWRLMGGTYSVRRKCGREALRSRQMAEDMQMWWILCLRVGDGGRIVRHKGSEMGLRLLV